jgi:hypothetical protein
VSLPKEVESLVDGHERLKPFFAAWPCFHDAEVVEMHLWRGRIWPGDWDDRNVFPVLTCKIQVLEATQPGATHAGNDVLVTLRFHDADQINLQGFNHDNSIVALSFSRRHRGTFSTGEELPPSIMVTFEAGHGMNASFSCSRMEIVAAERYESPLLAASKP